MFDLTTSLFYAQSIFRYLIKRKILFGFKLIHSDKKVHNQSIKNSLQVAARAKFLFGDTCLVGSRGGLL